MKLGMGYQHINIAHMANYYYLFFFELEVLKSTTEL